jgi:mutator protein MutT
MRFSSDTIKEIQEVALSRNLFDKKDLFKDTHNGGTAPSYVVEQWITQDANDKAYTEYGFDVDRTPIGTWFVLSQITDQNYWDKEIKGNKKYAYSIEALLNLTIIKMSSQNQQFGDVVVFNNNDEFLLLQRSDNDNYMPNKLCFAGGKIEQGEDVEKGALRELFEETGIKAEKADFIETIRNSDGTKSHYFSVKTDQAFKPSKEHKGYSWVKSLDNFEPEMFIEGDKERLVKIINKIKMEKEQIVLPDGEHLINGTIYVVKDGIVIEKKDVTMEQEEVIEEVVETAPEELAETPEAPEEVKPEVMAEVPTPTEEVAEVLPSEDRLAKLEAENESILMEIAKLRAEMVTPQEEEVAVQMSDNRPMWKRISDGLHQLKK